MKLTAYLMAAAAIAAGGALTASAQSAIDAYNMNTSQLRGTARFIAMGGAFTSLGGDISCMTQNPAGLGLYRRSEIGGTFDVSIRSYAATTPTQKNTTHQTKAFFDNLGYVGTANLGGTLRTFTWGVSYNRLAEHDRRFSGYNNPTSGSLSNYIASFTNGVNSGDMLFNDATKYNPYLDSDIDWLSILAYNSYMISNIDSNNDGDKDRLYAGLYQNGTVGDALYTVHERGYTDEYNIDFAGNISDILYWGIGVGIVDMNYRSAVEYSESMSGALIYGGTGNKLTTGNAGFGILNQKQITGTGANLKFGLIIRPVDMLRIGFAIHTPSWMSMSSTGYADTQFNYTPDGTTNTLSNSEYTETYDYNWKMNTPWRFMVGVSAVFGTRAILSLDYERVAYNDTKVKYQNYSSWGDSYVSDDKVNTDTKEYFQASNIVRVGLEYRITPRFSARAGFNYQTSNVRDAAADGYSVISTAGTDPSYTFNKATENICLGLGYRYKGWYIDLTYQHVRHSSTFHAYTPYDQVTDTPSANVVSSLNNIVISTGIRF